MQIRRTKETTVKQIQVLIMKRQKYYEKPKYDTHNFCKVCGINAEKPINICPQCNRKMRTRPSKLTKYRESKIKRIK